MGEIIIKVPGDIREEFEIKNINSIGKDKLKEIIQKLEHYDFVIKNLDKVIGKIEVEEAREEKFINKMGFFVDSSIFVEAFKKSSSKEHEIRGL